MRARASRRRANALYRRGRVQSRRCPTRAPAPSPSLPPRACDLTIRRCIWEKLPDRISRVEGGGDEHVGDEILLLRREALAVRRPVVLVRALEVGKLHKASEGRAHTLGRSEKLSSRMKAGSARLSSLSLSSLSLCAYRLRDGRLDRLRLVMKRRERLDHLGQPCGHIVRRELHEAHQR